MTKSKPKSKKTEKVKEGVSVTTAGDNRVSKLRSFPLNGRVLKPPYCFITVCLRYLLI